MPDNVNSETGMCSYGKYSVRSSYLTKGTNRYTLTDRRQHTLAQKRSFFVRMVSDPKCYNPKIVRHLQVR